MTPTALPGKRPPLTRATVLAAAVALADTSGIETLSMRNLARDLGVVAMALYKHIANKEELLDGMVEAVIAEFDPPAQTGDWAADLRERILSARRTMLRHPWAAQVFAGRPAPTRAVLAHLDSVAAGMLAGGLSPALTHQGLHMLGSLIWGFHLEVFPSGPPPQDPAEREEMMIGFAAAYPAVLTVAMAASHDPAAIVGAGCDDQAEFELTIDLVLDGLKRLHEAGWPAKSRKS